MFLPNPSFSGKDIASKPSSIKDKNSGKGSSEACISILFLKILLVEPKKAKVRKEKRLLLATYYSKHPL